MIIVTRRHNKVRQNIITVRHFRTCINEKLHYSFLTTIRNNWNILGVHSYQRN
jgi:hypothetical protein